MVREGMTFEAAKEKLLGEVRGNFEAFLADRQPGQPFCYWFGPTLTHREYEKGSGQALWGIEPDSLKGKLPKFLPDVPEVRADFTDYLGEIQAWDAGVGVLIQKARSHRRTRQHGRRAQRRPRHARRARRQVQLYDFGVGVALIARVPGVPGGRVVDDFVNLMDLAPTFLEIGGLKPPAVMTGRSFWDVLRSRQIRPGQIPAARGW